MTILHTCASFQRVRSHSGRKDRDREGGRERERETKACHILGSIATSCISDMAKSPPEDNILLASSHF